MVSVPFDVKKIFPDVVVSALFIARVEAPAALLKTVRVPAVRAPFTVNPVLPYKKALLEIVRALLIVTAPPRLLDVVQLRLPAPTQALKVVVGRTEFMSTVRLPLPLNNNTFAASTVLFMLGLVPASVEISMVLFPPHLRQELR